MMQPVVVGFDDLEHSAKAVECAVREAVARQTSLRVVHAYSWIPMAAGPGVSLEAMPMEDVRKAISVVLDEAVQKIRDEHLGLTVEAVLVQGDASQMLADAGRDASLLVVGGRGRGGFAGLLLGSVALRVLAMAECAVMVVRGGKDSRVGRITVGVDLLSAQVSTDALEFAFAEARLRAAELSVLNVWENPYHTLGILGSVSDTSLEAFASLQRDILAEIVEPLQRKYPDVAVTQKTTPGVPSQALVAATAQSDVVVIGGDARGKRPGMKIGALAHIVLHHADCPVVVVPEH